MLKLDNQQLGVKRLKVAISNPPKRAAPATNYPSSEGEAPANRGGNAGGREDGGGFKRPSLVPSQARPRAVSHNEQDPL